MRLFKPHSYFKSIRKINFDKLHKQGYRGILFDIDNTLVAHGEGINNEVTNFIDELKAKGYKIGLVSNNSRERVSRFNNKIRLPYISKAKKPLPYSYKRLSRKLGLSSNKVIFVGDQLFTDILGANLAGIRSILVKPINEKEPLGIKIKRILEKFLMKFIMLRCYE